jgi:hypothetical protein
MTQKSEATIECDKIFELKSRTVGLAVINTALTMQLQDINGLISSIVKRLRAAAHSAAAPEAAKSYRALWPNLL